MFQTNVIHLKLTSFHITCQLKKENEKWKLNAKTVRFIYGHMNSFFKGPNHLNKRYIFN